MKLWYAMLIVGLAICSAQLGTVRAGDRDDKGSPDSCGRCRCHAPCQPVTCQIVCDTKKEKKTRWRVECSLACPLLPGCCLSRNGEESGDAEKEAEKANCAGPPPRCGRPRTVRKLVKEEYEVSIPVYRCEVRYLCDKCCEDAAN
jgi:hypothetical protein